MAAKIKIEVQDTTARRKLEALIKRIEKAKARKVVPIYGFR